MREIRTHGSNGRGSETGRQVPRRSPTPPRRELMKLARGARPPGVRLVWFIALLAGSRTETLLSVYLVGSYGSAVPSVIGGS